MKEGEEGKERKRKKIREEREKRKNPDLDPGWREKEVTDFITLPKT